MKNRISDLRNHMFAQLERLGDENLSQEQLSLEISRSKAISDLGKVVVESAKTELLHAKLVGGKSGKELDNRFMDEDITEHKAIERPAAEYSNMTQDKIISKYAPEETAPNNL